MNNIWLSIVIPAYNCRDTISRLLDSIVVQYVKNTEVVICDDNSTDNFMEKVEPYKDILNIVYCKTKPREMHCPGNTRFDGWKYATGEWLTFIDNDDVFEPDAFISVKRIIDTSKEDKLVYTKFREWNYEDDTCIQEYDGITWMHGKFYNRQWLIDNGIDFKENLFTHEDLYFNDRVFSYFIANNMDFTKSDIFTYKWIYRPESVSREKYKSVGGRLFIRDNFEDYVYASYDPWMIEFSKHPEKDEIFFNQMCSVILYQYLYYQGFIWYYGEDHDLSDVYNLIKEKTFEVLKAFNRTKKDMLDHIHSIPAYYGSVKIATQGATGKYVESKSFDDFINNL